MRAVTDRKAPGPVAGPDWSSTSRRRRAGVAGIVAAGAALAVTELVSALGSASSPPVISSVAGRVVDLSAGALKSVAVSLFGTNDKAALLTGIVVVSLAMGGFIGVPAARQRWFGIGAFGGFALVGILAGWADPQASFGAVVVACVAGSLVGIVTLDALLRLAQACAPMDGRPPGAQDPRVKVADRRTFLLATGGAGAVVAVAALGSRGLRGTSRAAESRAAATLPAPGQTVPLPAGQPFHVDGLSPYVTPNADFYRIDTAIFVPQVDASSWKLTIKGMVDRPVSFTFADLLAMDLVEEPITLACVSNNVGGPLIGNAVWRGVPLRQLLDRAGVQAGATQIVGRSVDDFTVGFPTEKAFDGRSAMVAVGMNGELLPVNHGYPARLLVAGLYGYVSATKWLKEIQLTRLEDFDAYWVPRGWSKEAPIKLESRVDVPRSGATILAGKTAIAGVAWAPTVGISRVEVQLDDGPWQAAQLGDAASKNTWVQWLYEWDAVPGQHVVAVRAYDSTGLVQTDVPRPPDPDGATGYHYRGFTVK